MLENTLHNYQPTQIEIDIITTLFTSDKPMLPPQIFEALGRKYSIIQIQSGLLTLYKNEIVSYERYRRFRLFYSIITEEKFNSLISKPL